MATDANPVPCLFGGGNQGQFPTQSHWNAAFVCQHSEIDCCQEQRRENKDSQKQLKVASNSHETAPRRQRGRFLSVLGRSNSSILLLLALATGPFRPELVDRGPSALA